MCCMNIIVIAMICMYVTVICDMSVLFFGVSVMCVCISKSLDMIRKDEIYNALVGSL